jgi:O-antigen/teichoic acid export membrane protein
VASSRLDLTRGGLLARNFLLNLAGWLLPALAALVAMPLLVRGLGDARFGILALTWATLGYFSLFDLGIGRAVTHAVADLVGRNRDSEIGRVVWTSLATLVPVGIIGTSVIFAVAPWIVQLLTLPPSLYAETVLAFRIVAFAIPFVGIAAALRGVLEARQRFDAVNMLRVPHGLVTFLGPLAALPFSHSVVPAIAILTVSRALLCVAHFFVCLRYVPEFGNSSFAWSRDAIRQLLSFGGWMTVSNIISPLMNTLDRFVVGAMLSVSVVTYYAAPSEAVTKMWLFTAALHPVFFPALATTGVREPRRTAALFDRLARVTFAGLFLPTVIAVLLAPEILNVWLGPAFALRSATVLQVLAIGVFVNTLGQAALTLVQSLGRPDITGKYHMAELPVYAAALWFLLPRFGILGAAFAWSGRAIIDAMLLLFTCPVLLKECRASVLRTVVWLGVAMVGLLLFMSVGSLWIRGVVAAVTIPAWMATAWWGILTPQERRAPARVVIGVLRPERV